MNKDKYISDMENTTAYYSREVDIRQNLSQEQAIRSIERNYGAKADINNKNFDAYDQLLACVAIAEDEIALRKSHYSLGQASSKSEEIGEINENDNLNENVNDTCKSKIQFKLNQSKWDVIQRLNTYNCKTPTYLITKSLEELFQECKSTQGHWSYIAERYTVRSINQVIVYMIKQYGDWSTLQNSASYFTRAIKFRKQKRLYTNR